MWGVREALKINIFNYFYQLSASSFEKRRENSSDIYCRRNKAWEIFLLINEASMPWERLARDSGRQLISLVAKAW